MTTATSTSLLSELILVRLLVAGRRSPAPSQVRKELTAYCMQAPSAEQWEALRRQLAGAGLLAGKGFRLTDGGRAQALAFLGVRGLPKGTGWKVIKARYLLPKALGIDPDATQTRKRIAREDGLAAFLLREKFDLPAGAGNTLTRAVDALVCKRLGFAEATSWEEIRQAVLGDMLGAGDGLDIDKLRKQLVRKEVGATRGIEGLRQAVLRRWLAAGDQPEPAAPAPEETEAHTSRLDLPEFARTVRAVARTCPSGWFGDNKVFISHVWRQSQNEPGFPKLDLAAFKARLVEANRANLLRLSRADLVEAMDPTDVRESEIRYLTAEFHFILVENEQP